MADAPEKIWADPDGCWWKRPFDPSTEYTRTDVALAMVAAEREAIAGFVDRFLMVQTGVDVEKVVCCLEAIRARTDDDTQAALVARDARIKQEARNEALREVINLVNGCDRVSEVQPAIENLITED